MEGRPGAYRLSFDLHVCATVCEKCNERNPSGGGEEGEREVETRKGGAMLHTHTLSRCEAGHCGQGADACKGNEWKHEQQGGNQPRQETLRARSKARRTFAVDRM